MWLRIYASGEVDWLKSRKAALRTALGPWAPRRLAACSYARAYGQLSKNWYWAAQSLYITVPEPPVRATPIGESFACARYLTNSDPRTCSTNAYTFARITFN